MKNNWELDLYLLDCLSFGYVTNDFLLNICDSLFEIIDDEISQSADKQHSESSVLGACLALLTEISKRISQKEITLHETAIGASSASLVDHITSNMLARSNLNNNTMRLGIMHYLSKVKPLSQIEWQRVTSRFGQSLLEHVFQTYFAFGTGSQNAFHFLSQHLGKFLCSSPALAEMTGAVLQNQMLKNPDEFPNFMQKYIDFALTKDGKNFDFLRSLCIHLSFLTKTACDVNQKKIFDPMFKVLTRFLSFFDDSKQEVYSKLKNLVEEILSTSKTLAAKELLQALAVTKIRSKPKSNSIRTHMDRKGVSRENMHSIINPLEEILFLAS